MLAQGRGVRAAACAVREDVPGVPQLVGYVVPRDGVPVDEGLVRAHLRRHLPAYMVPALIETVADLPRLPSGKLDRAALPAPHARPAAPRPAHARPRTDTERRIAQAWESMFRPRTVGRDDHFFYDLGGHSLRAAQAVSLLRADPQFETLSVIDVYHHPTVAALAAAVDARRLGARFGRDVYIHTTGLIEFDLVEVGDRAALNEDCVLQTHLFEDRVLKASWLRIDADCAVGTRSVVLYDTRMEAGARLDGLSLLMKGERLPASTAWAGVPATWRGRSGAAAGPVPAGSGRYGRNPAGQAQRW